MSESYETHLAQATTALRAAQRALSDEISSYPTPISGCDAQFNGLIRDRSRISSALGALAQTPFVPTPRQPVPDQRMESR